MVLTQNILILVFMISHLIKAVLLTAPLWKIMARLIIELIHMDSFNAVLGIG